MSNWSQNSSRVEGNDRQCLWVGIAADLKVVGPQCQCWYSYDLKIAVPTSGSGLGLVGSKGLAMLVKLL